MDINGLIMELNFKENCMTEAEREEGAGSGGALVAVLAAIAAVVVGPWVAVKVVAAGAAVMLAGGEDRQEASGGGRRDDEQARERREAALRNHIAETSYEATIPLTFRKRHAQAADGGGAQTRTQNGQGPDG